MTIGLMIATIIGLLLATVVGFLRDLQRALVTLAGTFLGASLVSFWASTWGQTLAKRFGSQDPKNWILTVSLALFLGTVLLIGYGGGALIGPRKRETLIVRRLEAALIGLLNGLLAMGYVVRFVADSGGQREAIGSTPLLRALSVGLPYLVLIIAATIALMAMINSVAQLVRRKPAVAPIKASVPPTSTAAPKPVVAVPTLAEKQRIQELADKLGQRQGP